MPGTIGDLREERVSLHEQMKDVLDTAETEKRDLTAEDRQKYDELETQLDSLGADIERYERANKRSQQFGEAAERVLTAPPEKADEPADKEAPKSLAEYKEQQRGTLVQDEPEYRQAFYKWLTSIDDRQLEAAEHRVLSKATAGAGLNLVPTEFRRTLIDALREFGVMRDISTVFSTEAGEAISIPSVVTHGVATWTAENAAYTVSDEAFDTMSLNAYKAATIMLVSEELLADSAFDLEAFIRTQFGLRIGILENTAYVSGDGSGKPTGVRTQASAGVTAASATAITSDELMDLYYSLLSPYRNNGTWLFKDSTIKLIRKLKDADNQYIWAPGLTAGQPDTLLSRPVRVDPDMSAATAGLISVLFGDFSYYWIRDVDGVAFQRLEELYAANGQVGFRAYHRTDGKLTNTAAIKKLTQL